MRLLIIHVDLKWNWGSETGRTGCIENTLMFFVAQLVELKKITCEDGFYSAGRRSQFESLLW